jgi:hypothetical protein
MFLGHQPSRLDLRNQCSAGISWCLHCSKAAFYMNVYRLEVERVCARPQGGCFAPLSRHVTFKQASSISPPDIPSTLEHLIQPGP